MTSMNNRIAFTPEFVSSIGGYHGVVILREVNRKAGTQRVADAKAIASASIRDGEGTSRQRIAAYDELFNDSGHMCPLGHQLDRTLAQGLPTLNRFVDTLLLCEMSTGVLMGAQDYGAMRGTLRFDVARGDEPFSGMRSKSTCRSGEPIIRDDEGIIASLLQGSDDRTAITRQTADVVFFGFGVGVVGESEVRMALAMAQTVLGPAAAESISEFGP